MRQLKISKQIPNRESQSLDKCLQEIGKVDLISADEEVELAKRIKDGDQVALEKLTKANLKFVVSVARQYQNQGLTLGNLINEGSFVIFPGMRLLAQGEENRLMNNSFRREVQPALSTLTQHKGDVITKFFGLNGEQSITLEEIGAKFTLTR